jgi:hypothetical protein
VITYDANTLAIDPQFCAPETCSTTPLVLGDFRVDWGSKAKPSNSPCGALIGAYSDFCPHTGVGDGGNVPGGFKLHAPSPNPFRASTVIVFDLPRPATVDLRVYDLQGRVVRTLVENTGYDPGQYEIIWDGRDDRGRIAPPGVYFYRLAGRNFGESRKMVILR